LDPMREPVQVFMCQSGTESVEGALKLARYVTGRPRFIAFLGGFHGRSMGSLAFTASKYTQQAGFFPAMPGVTHVPYPNAYRPLFAGPDQGRATLDYIENVLFQSNVPATEVAAIVVAPIQGEGGYLVPPAGKPTTCAAALATLDLVEKEYAANAAEVGNYCIGRLRALQSQFECIGEVRGKGLMIGVELIADRASRKPATALCQRLLTRA